MVRFVHLTTDQTEIQAHKIHIIPMVCPACFLALPNHMGSPKSGVSILTWTSSIVVCLSSEVSVWETGTSSLHDVPWSGTTGWWCSGGRESLGTGAMGLVSTLRTIWQIFFVQQLPFSNAHLGKRGLGFSNNSFLTEDPTCCHSFLMIVAVLDV